MVRLGLTLSRQGLKRRSPLTTIGRLLRIDLLARRPRADSQGLIERRLAAPGPCARCCHGKVATAREPQIGQGLAAARGLNPKHATKQVDRLLSNPMINVDDILVRWVPYVVGARNDIVVALDLSLIHI